jgi:hypothetical protein
MQLELVGKRLVVALLPVARLSAPCRSANGISRGAIFPVAHAGVDGRVMSAFYVLLLESLVADSLVQRA